MFEKKFVEVIQKDEEIKWCNNVNSGARAMKAMKPVLTIFLVLGVFISFPSIPLFLTKEITYEIFLTIYKIFGLVVAFTCLVAMIFSNIKSFNTFFCITNKRVILRTGAFANDYVHYSLKNIGTIKVDGSIFDKKGKNASANLQISVKDFHNNTDGVGANVVLGVSSLYNVYEAYNMLSEMVEGNNEVLRIKTEV